MPREKQTHETLKQIGAAIRAGAVYLPIRNLAAAIASTAPPKNYLGQAEKIFKYIVNHWRYVRDPHRREMLATDPAVMFNLVLGADGRGAGMGRGVGDCDDIAAVSGAMLSAVGFPVRISTTAAPSNHSGGFDHVFVQFNHLGGWVSFDPVLHPFQGFADTAAHSQIAHWDLNGRALNNGEKKMDLRQIGLAGSENDGAELVDYGEVICGFGSAAEELGYIDDPGVQCEMSGAEEIGGYSVNPVIELSGADFVRLRENNNQPWHGLLGLADDGSLMMFDANLGFFKRLRRRMRKGIRRVASRFKKIGKKILSVTPGGKTLMKFGRRILPIAKRLIKAGSKLAPIAAFIPGVGPAAAIALRAAGRGINVAERAQRLARRAQGRS